MTKKIAKISEKLKNEIPKLQTIKIIEDNNISEDGTVVESLLSRVDNRLRIQLDQIVEQFMFAHYSSQEDDAIVEEIPADTEVSDVEQTLENTEIENISDLFNADSKNEE